MQPGQFLVNRNNEKLKILDFSKNGNIVFFKNDYGVSLWRALDELKEDGWSLLEEPWMPKSGDYVWVVEANGHRVGQQWDSFDEKEKEFLIKTGNHFRTSDDAELYKQKLIEVMGRKEG